MTPHDARVALVAAGLVVDRVERIEEGWASWTFDVDDEWIVRFPRNAGVAAGHAREAAVLPLIARHVPFAVPSPEPLGEHAGLPFHRYRKLAGRPLEAGDLDVDGIAAMLRALHDVPIDEAAAALGDAPTDEAWLDRYRSLWPRVDAEVLPLVDTDIAAAMRDEMAVFLDGDIPIDLALIHGDLGPEHILVDDTTGAISIIDFADVAIGDPAHDFVGFSALLGVRDALGVINRYGVAPGFTGRFRIYRWMGAVEAALYGIDEGDEAIVADAIEGIHERGAPRPRACAAAVRGDQILMVRYDDRFWTLPGGGVEPGESAADAAVRELVEEAGITGRVTRLLYQDLYMGGSSSCFLVDVADAEAVLTGDPQVTDVQWFPLSEVADDVMVSRVIAALDST